MKDHETLREEVRVLIQAETKRMQVQFEKDMRTARRRFLILGILALLAFALDRWAISQLESHYRAQLERPKN